jgi:hypothetical protein
MSVLAAARNRIEYAKAKRHPEDEQADLCSTGQDVVGADYYADADIESPEFIVARSAADGASVPHGGRKLKTIKGMGSIYDWRTSPWTPANGGRIRPLVFVQHIPVVSNIAGIADFVRLRDVLVAQGLMVQNATDAEGNVAMFTPMDVLCYQARGANQVSCGTEHMHASIGEEWSQKQFRAAAWLVNQALDKFGIPAFNGELGGGNGTVRVIQRGQVSHMRVSQAAGFNDRSDPGPGYDWERVRSYVLGWRERIRNGTADSKGFEGL